MKESDEVRRIREAYENDHPEEAARLAARRFEAESIELPELLKSPDPASSWDKLHADAVTRVWRELVLAGPDGLSLTELMARAGSGKYAQTAIARIREIGVVTESRRNPGGFDQDEIVLSVKP